MNDLEINKRLAEIEGLEGYGEHKGKWVNLAMSHFYDIRAYDPLHDDAQAFRLMLKHLDGLDRVADGTLVADSDPRRAICLAVIEKHE